MKRYFAIVLALSTLLHAAPSVAAGPTAEERAAAQKEGVVTWYTALMTASARDIADAAQKALGLRIDITRMTSGQLTTRILQEEDQHVANADVLNMNLEQVYIDMKAKHQLLPFTPTSIGSYADPAYYDPDHTWHLVAFSLGTIQYNTERVTGDMIPHRWHDLLDPRYAGKIIVGDPRLGGSSLTDAYFLSKIYGWGFFDKLKANGVVSLPNCSQPTQLASGERLIAICDHGLTPPAQARGMPIETIFPSDGVFVSPQPIAILADAPHPNAAKVFVDWLLSPAGQSMIVQGGVGSPLNDPSIAWPAKYPKLSQMKLMVIQPSEFAAWLPEAKREWSRLFGG